MPRDRWLDRARVCGLVPLVVSTIVFAGFLVWPNDFWIWAAIATIVFAFVLVGLGLVFLAIHVLPLMVAAGREEPQPSMVRPLVVLALLLSNVPLFALYGYIGSFALRR